MAEKNIVQETFPVLGMSCASCSARVEKTLNHQSGVKKAVVNYASATATVEYDPTSCSSETLQQAVQAAGYDLLINQDGNTIIRKSKFPQNPKRSVRFSGKRTKRSVQKRKARNTQKAETKVL